VLQLDSYETSFTSFRNPPSEVRKTTLEFMFFILEREREMFSWAIFFFFLAHVLRWMERVWVVGVDGEIE
jgi:hypothetical protein